MAQGGANEVAGESRRHKKNQGKGDGKESEVVSEARVEEGEEIEKKDGADGKEKGVSKGKRNGKLGEGRAEKLALPPAEEEKETEQ